MKGKKKGSGMSDIAKEAKMKVLKSMSEKAESDMGEALGKKIVIQADSVEGLREGLDVAKDKLDGMKEDTVDMDKEDFVEEHERLVDTLRSPDREDDLEEADEQEDELEQYTDEDMEDIEEEAYDDNEEVNEVESEIKELERKLKELKSKR